MRFTTQINHARDRLNRLRTRLTQAQEANLQWPSTRREDLIDHIHNEIKQIERQSTICTPS